MTRKTEVILISEGDWYKRRWPFTYFSTAVGIIGGGIAYFKSSTIIDGLTWLGISMGIGFTFDLLLLRLPPLSLQLVRSNRIWKKILGILGFILFFAVLAGLWFFIDSIVSKDNV